MKDPYDFEEIVLPNGLTVYYKRDTNPWISAGFVIHAGVYHEPVRLGGLAHFTEHAVSLDLGTISEVNKKFELLGGSVALGTTDFFATYFDFKSPLNNFTDNLNLFAKMLLNTTFEEKDIEAERSIILNEFYEYYFNEEEFKKARKLSRNLFKNVDNTLEKKVLLGSLKDIKKINSVEIKKFYQKYYTPTNMSVIILGRISKKDALKEVLKSGFGKKFSGQRAPLPQIADFSKIKTYRHAQIYRYDCINGMVQMSNLLPKNFKKEELLLFTDLLYQTLFEKIREEKKAAYKISVKMIDRLFSYESTIEISSFDLRINIEKTIERVLKSINKEKQVFYDCKKALLNKLVLSEHTSKTTLEEMIKMVAENQIITKTQLLKKISKVRFETMIEIARYYQKRSYTILCTS